MIVIHIKVSNLFFQDRYLGRKKYEEFFTQEEDYDVNKYESLGFINTPDIKISFEEVEAILRVYLII